MAQMDVIKGVLPQIKGSVGIPIILIIMLAMMVLPLPPFLLDVFFTFNISLSLIVLLAGIYAKRPLDFAVFPTVLLVATLLRLALNIASTRVVLLYGQTGSGAAGKVIESFGEVVVGGNYAVGFAVFIILIIINFVVVTKGAGRISEVTARFTLDAMPGKQMGIDADLNAGLINQEEAKQRRDEISKESDFYGSMDGASKFVRGDAIAGILILVINLIGGIAIGAIQHDMEFISALQVYGLLTIGDGLVAQIPSIVLSTAAAIMVTRVSSEQEIGNEVAGQLFADYRVLFITGTVLVMLGIIPGMPHFAFLSIGLLSFGGAYAVKHFKKAKAREVEIQAEQKKESEEPKVKELGWDDVNPVDLIGLEIGYRLIPLVDKKQGGQLMARIKGVRKKLSQELGFLVPSVHIRDNLELSPNEYRLQLMGVLVGHGEVQLDKELAINPGQVAGALEGIETKDPAFGLPAYWIEPSLREHAQTLGYTVVDPSTVIATHLSTQLNENAADLIGHDEVAELIQILQRNHPKLAESITDIAAGVIVKILQNLLREQVPIRDIKTIAEVIAENAGATQDAEVLTNFVRSALSRLIIQSINGNDEEIPVITLDPNLERILQQSMQNGNGTAGASLEPSLAEKVHTVLSEMVQKQENIGEPAILIVPGVIRNLLSRFFRASIRGLHVLAYNEIPDNKQIKIIGTIGQ